MALPYAILLRNVNGRKKSDVSSGFVNKEIFKGKLLITLSHDEVDQLKHQVATGPLLKYKSLEDPTTVMYCDDDAVHWLNEAQKEILLAIDHLSDRCKAVNQLEWAENLDKGSDVYVAVTGVHNNLKGIVRYIGDLSGEKGTRFGIELMEQKNHGSCNGRFRGKEYFHCDSNSAVFVSLDKLSPHPTAVSTKASSVTASKSKQVLHLQKPIEQRQPVLFERGDRVSVVDNNNEIVMGTVRWSGRGVGPKGNIVGIETDVEINLKNYPKHEIGINHYFTPVSGKQGVHLFLPNDSVIKETKDIALKKGNKGKVLPLQNKTEDGYDSHAAAKSLEKQNAGGQSKMIEKESAMWKDAAMKLNQKITQLKANHNEHKVATSDAITKLQEGENEMKKKFTTLEEMIQQNASNIQMMNSALTDFHKSNLELKASNAYLQDQLSLTQQQLLGLQSMIFISKGWLVSHDQFVIGKEIGRGAWATVHEATLRGATVAAKCLHDVITSPKTRELFQREMDVALICQHENVVTFLGATMEGAPVILMELMDMNLRKAYEEETVKDHQIHGILHDVAKALHFLHTRPDPVIHRDVSSANVLLKVLYNGEWLAKLGDLGTAKIQQQVATAGPGAIAYGAPEARNPDEHSPKMDVYNFGIVIIETLTKTHPFQMVDTLKAQVQQQYSQYDLLVTSCTKQQSSDRPTMYDVLIQLNGIDTATANKA